MNFENLIPNKILFSLKELQSLGLLKVSTAKKLINQGDIVAHRVGVKLFISRIELNRYFTNNIVVR